MNIIGKPRPPRRRPRQGHRPDQVRRRPDAAADGCTASCCARRVPHARIVRDRRRRARWRIPGVHLVLTGARLPDPVRHPAGQPGRARALPSTRVRFVGDPVAAVVARDEETAFEALRSDRRRVRAAAHLSPIRGEPRARRAAHPRLRRRRQHPQGRVAASSATSTRRFADADHVFEDSFFFEGNTHLPIEQHAAVAAQGSRRQARRSGRATQTPHYVHRALAKALAHAGGAHPRHRHAERRRLRRQERSVQPRDRRRQGGAAHSAGR